MLPPYEAARRAGRRSPPRRGAPRGCGRGRSRGQPPGTRLPADPDRALTLPSQPWCHAGGVSQGTVVVIEDDAHISDLVDMLLRAEGFRVIQASEGQAGIAAIERERP